MLFRPVATARRFGSTVALKETFFDDPNLRRAFEREARLLNRLRHAALPRVSDHFEEAAGQFLVMEYIAGEDLSQMLKGRGGAGFPAGQALVWADQLLDALDYLHTQEPPVVHRDIKPQNLKLTARDQIVLLDFGLAKGTPLQTRVTATGSLFGYSFNYAPIEQMQGAGTDPRSDLYSLGATLYHLLTGAPPPDALTRATAVLNGDPDPLRPASETAAHVHPLLAEALSRAMALSAARRFASAAEMRDALREAARSATDMDATAAGAHAATPTDESEQKTRLLGSKATGLAGAQDAATIIADDATPPSGDAAKTHAQTAAARTTAAHEAPATRTGDAGSTSFGDPDAKSAPAGESEGRSVVTRVRMLDAPPARGPRRGLGLAVGGAVFIALALGVYAYMWRAPAPEVAPAPQPAAQPAQTPTPERQRQPAEAGPPPAAPPKAAPAATSREQAPARPEPVEPAAPAAPQTPPGDLPPEAAADPLLRGRDLRTNPLTDAEL